MIQWESTYAVLIGIEAYQKQGISSVQYALADSAAMKEVLVQHFGVPPRTSTFGLIPMPRGRRLKRSPLHHSPVSRRSIRLLLCRSWLLRQWNQSSDHMGHPSEQSGRNNVSLEEVLLKPLKEEPGLDSLVFIDACAADLKASIVQARDIVSDMTRTEFEALVQSTDHAAAFFACLRMKRPTRATPSCTASGRTT